MATRSRASRKCARDTSSGCFFFQAEDGIRDLTVTGVQTCALPIWSDAATHALRLALGDATTAARAYERKDQLVSLALGLDPHGERSSALLRQIVWPTRSEERRVGKSVGRGGGRSVEKESARSGRGR